MSLSILIGVPYSSFIVPTGGAPPYTFALVDGALPTGLTLDTVTGEISGTPTVVGVFTFSISYTDTNGLTGFSIDCSLEVVAETESYDCIDGVCVDPGDGSGAFATLAECIASGCSAVPQIGSHGVLMFDTRDEVKGWFFFRYFFDAVTGYAEEGVSTLVFGGGDGRLYLNNDVDTDDGVQIDCEYDTPWFDGGDPRSWKQFANGSAEVEGTVNVQALADNDTMSLGVTNIPAGTIRTRKTLDFAQGEHRNLGLRFTGIAPIDLFNFSHELTFVSVAERTELRRAFATAMVFKEFAHVYRAVVCYISNADIVITITVDNGFAANYTLPSSNGDTIRLPVIFQAIKGKAFDVQFQSSEDFQLIRDQSVFFTKEFRSPEEYHVEKPFGDVSQAV